MVTRYRPNSRRRRSSGTRVPSWAPAQAPTALPAVTRKASCQRKNPWRQWTQAATRATAGKVASTTPWATAWGTPRSSTRAGTSKDPPPMDRPLRIPVATATRAAQGKVTPASPPSGPSRARLSRTARNVAVRSGRPAAGARRWPRAAAEGRGGPRRPAPFTTRQPSTIIRRPRSRRNQPYSRRSPRGWSRSIHRAPTAAPTIPPAATCHASWTSTSPRAA